MDLLYNSAWYTVAMSGLVLRVPICWINDRNVYDSLSLSAPVEPLIHYQNMVSLCLFYSVGITFGRCSSELAELAVHPNSQGRLTPYFNRMHDFSVIISRC